MSNMKIVRIGYFGKVPATGDFVSRQILPSLKAAFDQWLQEALLESKKELGELWLNSFLSSPIWRFCLNKGIGETQNLIIGTMMPSVDKVGRYFPFSFIVEIEEEKITPSTLSFADNILEKLEVYLTSALEDDFDIEYLDYQLSAFVKKFNSLDNIRLLSSKSEESILDIVDEMSAIARTSGSIWWTEGSDYRQADILSFPKLPPSQMFAAFLRDPDIFSDLDILWSQARDLGLSHFDNGITEIHSEDEARHTHAISHPGYLNSKNKSYIAEFKNIIVISDGRFKTEKSALVSRFSCLAFQKLWKENQISQTDLRRLTAFLDEKIIDAADSQLLSDLSFTGLFWDKTNGPDCYVLSIGGSLCLHQHKEDVTNIFDNQNLTDASTVRKGGENGSFKLIKLQLEEGDKVLLATDYFEFHNVCNMLNNALIENNSEDATKKIWQEMLLKNVQSDITFAIFERAKSENL